MMCVLERALRIPLLLCSWLGQDQGESALLKTNRCGKDAGRWLSNRREGSRVPALRVLPPLAPLPEDLPTSLGCCVRSKQTTYFAPAGVAQWIGASFCIPKGWGFDSWSGHLPRLQVRSPIGNQLMFLSYIDVSLSLPRSLCLSLPLPSLQNQQTY